MAQTRPRNGTSIAVKHPKAVSVMVPKELGSYHCMVLLHDLRIAFVKVLPEPGFALLLLKEARRDVPHNVDLQQKRAGLSTD